jgi:predicted protein tyrosine phosphatase
VEIAFDTYWNVTETVQTWKPDAVISIMDASHLAPSLQYRSERHLKLGFHDIQRPEAGRTAPSSQHIMDMLEFVNTRRKTGARRVLVHCMAGVSRSPAAAYIIAVCVRNEDPLRAATLLIQAAPFVTPNMLMVKHADQLSGWGGAMAQALRSKTIGAQTRGPAHPIMI